MNNKDCWIDSYKLNFSTTGSLLLDIPITNLFISSSDSNIEGLSPNIDRANEQNIIQNSPLPEDIGEVPNDLDSLI